MELCLNVEEPQTDNRKPNRGYRFAVNLDLKLSNV